MSANRRAARAPRSLASALAIGAAALLSSPATALAWQLPQGTAPELQTQPSALQLDSWTHDPQNTFRVPDEALPLPIVFVGSPVDGLSRDDMARALNQATSAWSEVACSYAELTFAGFRESLDDVESGEVPVYFDAGVDTRIAWVVYSPAGTVDGTRLVLNSPQYRWANAAVPFQDLQSEEAITVDVVSVLTHELGHVLGLGHTFAHNAATMAPRYLRDGSQKELSAVDKVALCQLYPQQGDECATDADCALGRACVATDYGRLCDIYLASTGEYCGYELQHCPDYCRIKEPDIGVGYCSTACDDDDACPEHFVCDTPPRYQQSVCLFRPRPENEQEEATGCSSTSSSTNTFAPFFLIFLLLIARRGRRSSPRS